MDVPQQIFVVPNRPLTEGTRFYDNQGNEVRTDSPAEGPILHCAGGLDVPFTDLQIFAMALDMGHYRALPTYSERITTDGTEYSFEDFTGPLVDRCLAAAENARRR